jgi:hypothetical protein
LATRTSAEYRFLDEQLQRSKKLLAVRGLNANHNHDLKNILKGTATLASVTAGPFQDFYVALLVKGMKRIFAGRFAAGSGSKVERGSLFGPAR